MKAKKNEQGHQSGKKGKDIFTVERILAKKIKKRKTFYFIKWFNYSDNFNSWEPEKNLKLDPSLIENFEKERKEIRRKSKSIQSN
jgi:hypothetical protein